MNRRQFVQSAGTAAVLAAATQSPAAASAEQATESPQSAAQSSPQVRTLSEQEVVDLMVGSSIQATRNSDTPGMIKRARRLLSEGRHFRVVEHAQVVEMAQAKSAPLAVHLAETRDELELLENGTGPLGSLISSCTT